ASPGRGRGAGARARAHSGRSRGGTPPPCGGRSSRGGRSTWERGGGCTIPCRGQGGNPFGTAEMIESAAMRVALVHDWLVTMRGGERVLDALCELYPQAVLFTLINRPGSVSA